MDKMMTVNIVLDELCVYNTELSDDKIEAHVEKILSDAFEKINREQRDIDCGVVEFEFDGLEDMEE